MSNVEHVYRDIKREPRIKPRGKDNGKYVVSLVPTNLMTTFISQLEAKLGPAIARSRGRWDMTTLVASLMRGEQQAWAAMTKDEEAFIDGVCVTEVIIYPTGLKMLALRYLGGDNMNDWVWPGLDVLDSFAKDQGCHGIEAGGRYGFWQWLEPDGFKRTFTTFEKRFD